ncbi:Na+/H+-exchanging protein [Aphelenchoides avenae]|nr:Na+/H+-exchanging protein [Aphelenchus avenae]
MSKVGLFHRLISFNWEHVQTPFTVALWLLVASIAKILFHVNKKFGDAIPDSALLIAVGLALGYVLHRMNINDAFVALSSTTFFLYLLPPIIFDAGYFMPNRQLFDNIDSVLLFAIVGTVWNAVSIGSTLLFMSKYGMFSAQFSGFEIFLFSSLISAVDPVAVIAVFEEIQVNEFLFINVFGEALFNDGITVASHVHLMGTGVAKKPMVLYQMFRQFTLINDDLSPGDYLAGTASFFFIALGGVLIGIAFAFIVSWITKYTERIKILAPVFIFVLPYTSYITAELFGLSSILALTTCGILMKQYVKGNITHDAAAAVKYFVKMLAQSSETVIFMFLGLLTMSRDHHWDTMFVVATVVSCIVYRSIGVVVQCAVLNRFRKKKFTAIEQVILSYGGLRGAIAFGLVVSLPASIVAKQMFMTTCLAVIFFTVFVQGMTMRPLLYLLKVERLKDRQPTLVENVYNTYFDYTMSGLEMIAGQRGGHSIRHRFEMFNAKVLKPMLMKNQQRMVFDASQIVRAYTKITLEEAVRMAAAGEGKATPSPRSRKSFAYDRPAYDTVTSKRSTYDTVSSGQYNVNQFLSSQENAEALYDMFSKLLDKKLDEIRRVPQQTPTDENDDIKDSYMAIIKPQNKDACPTGVSVAGGAPLRRNISQPMQVAHGVEMPKRSAEDPH